MVFAPYNAPTYFSPAYFLGLSATSSDPTTTTTTGLAPYNAPAYFSPTYFYGPSSVVPNNPVIPPRGLDHSSYQALLSLLRATGSFEQVLLGASIQRSRAGADLYPLAVVTPRGWEESDEEDPLWILRKVTFAITVVVKSLDGGSSLDQLDQLALAIKQVVDWSDLDGTCLPAMTRVKACRYDHSGHSPEQSICLEGEFSSIVDPLTQLSASS